jgi:hypothetical protein
MEEVSSTAEILGGVELANSGDKLPSETAWVVNSALAL